VETEIEKKAHAAAVLAACMGLLLHLQTHKYLINILTNLLLRAPLPA